MRRLDLSRASLKAETRDEEKNEWKGMTMKNQSATYLAFTVLIFLFIFSGYKVSFSQERVESKVVFYVK